MLTSSHGARCRGGRLPQLLVFLLHNVELACKILNGWAAGRPTGRRSRALCCVLKCGAMQWLRTHIPDDFWHKVHTEFCDINLRRRAELVAINRSAGSRTRKASPSTCPMLAQFACPLTSRTSSSLGQIRSRASASLIRGTPSTVTSSRQCGPTSGSRTRKQSATSLRRCSG